MQTIKIESIDVKVVEERTNRYRIDCSVKIQTGLRKYVTVVRYMTLTFKKDSWKTVLYNLRGGRLKVQELGGARTLEAIAFACGSIGEHTCEEAMKLAQAAGESSSESPKRSALKKLASKKKR